MRVVIPSVNYGDHLAVTLPAWQKVCPPDSITVVTAPEDDETQRVAGEAGVRVFVTDAWRRHDERFQTPTHWHAYWRERGRKDHKPVMNKALAMDEAFGFVGDRVPRPAIGEACLALDADCYPVGQLPDERTLAPDTLYGCRRFDGRPDLTRGEEIKLRGRVLQSQHKHVSAVAGGYFQLFQYRKRCRFGSYPGADGYDYDFAFLWQKGIVLDSIHVLHFGETHQNWWGRVTPRWTPEVAS